MPKNTSSPHPRLHAAHSGPKVAQRNFTAEEQPQEHHPARGDHLTGAADPHCTSCLVFHLRLQQTSSALYFFSPCKGQTGFSSPISCSHSFSSAPQWAPMAVLLTLLEIKLTARRAELHFMQFMEVKTNTPSVHVMVCTVHAEALQGTH